VAATGLPCPSAASAGASFTLATWLGLVCTFVPGFVIINTVVS
jgi:hypothetical protein